MRAGRWRVYLNPFNQAGVYSGYQEISSDVVFSSLGAISQNLDNTDYDIGIYRISNIKLSVDNSSGKYSDVGQSTTSIFQYKRQDSLVKITWEAESDGILCGNFVAGNAILSQETTMFIGLLNDESATMDLDSKQIGFYTLGREVLLDRVNTPNTLANGDLISATILKCLNQSVITAQLGVSGGNITLGADVTLDDVSSMANRTVKDVVDDLLLISDSVLYIDANSNIIVAPRTAGSTVAYTFRGQASTAAPENIQNIKSIKSGTQRVFNYFTWKNTGAVSSDLTSILKYGTQIKELDFPYITNSTHQQTLMAALLTDFKNPKMEFQVYTPHSYDTISLNLLNKTQVDYPTPYYESEGVALPICGIAICGSAVLPKAQFSFTLDSTRSFKIIGKSVDPQTGLSMFNLREI